MIGTIRRHQKWLWAIIITVTIISFVVFFSPTSKMGSGRTAEYGTLNGETIRRDQYLAAYREAQLRYFFTNREWPDENASGRQRGVDMNRETRARLLLIQKLKEFKMEAGDDAVAQRISELFQDRDSRTFRIEAYQRFVKERLNPKGISEVDLQRFLRHEVGVQQLIAVVGLPGRLVTTNEALTLFSSENEQFATQIAFLSASNYLGQVTADPKSIGEFYTNRQALYRLPNRLQVNYVKFDVTNFFPFADQKMLEDTNLTAKIQGFYQQQGPQSFKDPAGNPLPPAFAQEKIKADIRREYALIEARRKANAFASELFDIVPPRVENLPALAARHNLPVLETAPFSQRETPPGLKVTEQFTKVAFNLSDQEPFGPPVLAEDGVYVVGLKQKIPSELPPFEAIQEKVSSDFGNFQAAQLARQAGSNFLAQATNATAQGKTFEAVASELQVNVQSLPLFSLATRSLPGVEDKINLNELKSVVSTLTPGKISGFMPTRDGGFVLFLKERVPVSPGQIEKEFPEFLQDLRMSRQYQVFNEWFRKEAEKARILGDASGPSGPAPE